MTEETLNQQRTRYAAELIEGSSIYDADVPTGVQDLLSDLMHLCRGKGYDFSELLRVATDNYNAEVAGVESESEAA